MLQMPKVTLEIQNMKYQIVHVLSQHNDEIESAIEQEVDRVIASYPFDSEVRSIALTVIGQIIKESIQEYFQYGDGKKFIDKVVMKSVGDAIKDLSSNEK